MNIFGHQNNNKGFTLIELLVVISIISLLATLAVASLNNARMKSRDARRLSDIENIRKAFDFFYDENGKYDGPVYSAGDKRISSTNFDPYLDESNVYDPLTDPTESVASAVQFYDYPDFEDYLSSYINVPHDPLLGGCRDTVTGKYGYMLYQKYSNCGVLIAYIENPGPENTVRCSNICGSTSSVFMGYPVMCVEVRL